MNYMYIKELQMVCLIEHRQSKMNEINYTSNDMTLISSSFSTRQP